MPMPVPEPPPTGGRHDFVRRLGSSRFNYWFGYVANLTLIGWLASHASRDGHLAVTPTAMGLLALSGLLTWTLAEYLLHRFLYHQLPSFLSLGHGLHHASPRSLIGVPWWLTTVVVVGTFLGLGLVLDPPALGLFMAGCWSGYVLYCLAHHGSHHWRFRNPWLRRMRRHHMIHHAHSGYNWGFTTTVWDRVFGTHRDR